MDRAVTRLGYGLKFAEAKEKAVCCESKGSEVIEVITYHNIHFNRRMNAACISSIE